LEADSYEDAIRNAVSIGGDSDTISCMAGGIAEAYYKEIPKEIVDQARYLIDSSLRTTIKEFMERFCPYGYF